MKKLSTLITAVFMIMAAILGWCLPIADFNIYDQINDGKQMDLEIQQINLSYRDDLTMQQKINIANYDNDFAGAVELDRGIYVQKEGLELIVEDFLSKYGGIEFDRSYEALKDKISAAQNFRGLIVLLSALALAVSPLAGIFSQILFYGKRKLEFDVLRAVGAIRKDFLGVFLTDAAVLALLSGGLYAGVSFLAIRLACSFLNSRFAFIFTSAGTRASTFYPRMPLPFFFAGLVLTLLFAVFAVLLPAFLYKRSTTAHIATDFSKDDA